MSLPAWPHLHRPPATPGAPALLLLHGTGGNEHDLVGLADKLAPGAALLAPRGRVNEGGAARFFPRLAEGVIDPAEVVPHIDELADFLANILPHYGLDHRPDGLEVLGYSNGANTAAALLQLHPALPLRRAILLRPMVVLERSAPADSLAGRQILLLNGAHDPIVPTDHPGRLAALLRHGGARVEVQIHADAGHGLCAADIAAARAFRGA